MFCVPYEIGIGARSAGHASFFVPVFSGLPESETQCETCREMRISIFMSFSEICIRILRAPRQKLRQLRSVSGSFHPHVKSYDSLRLCALWCTPPTNWLVQQAAVSDLLQTLKGLTKWRCKFSDLHKSLMQVVEALAQWRWISFLIFKTFIES